ncbi:MAG: hypothetical protein R3F41_07440 [Gammaproteobacteria bacterium]|nr:hypothetical protein [Pseudomonadales bacterium]MCP5348754.1 hypothetical protein [Pseudomonadales bacterium]
MTKLKSLLVLPPVLLSFSLMAGTVQAQSYLGDFCWFAEAEGDTGGQPDIVKLAIQLIGEENLSVNGFVIATEETTDSPQILYGSGTIQGDQVIIGLTGNINNVDAAGSTAISVHLSLATVSGPFTVTGNVLNKETEEIVSFSQQGTLTLTSCP